MFFSRIKRGLLNIVKPIEDASVVLMTETSAWRNEVINEKAQERKAQRTKKEYDKEAIKSYRNNIVLNEKVKQDKERER